MKLVFILVEVNRKWFKFEIIIYEK